MRKSQYVFVLATQSVFLLNVIMLLWQNHEVMNFGSLGAMLCGTVFICSALLWVILNWGEWGSLSRLGCSILFSVQMCIMLPLWNNEGMWNSNLKLESQLSIIMVAMYTVVFYIFGTVVEKVTTQGRELKKRF